MVGLLRWPCLRAVETMHAKMPKTGVGWPNLRHEKDGSIAAYLPRSTEETLQGAVTLETKLLLPVR